MKMEGREGATFALACCVIAGVFFAFGMMLFFPVPEANRDVVNVVLGGLMTVGFAGVISYYFGSSQGSDQKNKTIETLAAGAVAPITTTTTVTTDQEARHVTEPAAGSPLTGIALGSVGDPGVGSSGAPAPDVTVDPAAATDLAIADADDPDDDVSTDVNNLPDDLPSDLGRKG